MAIVGVVLLGLIFLLCCMKSSNDVVNKHDQSIEEEPPRALQEEYMTACELYYRYCLDPQHYSDPRSEAKYDAGYKVYQMGFTPCGASRKDFHRTTPQAYAQTQWYCIDEGRYANVGSAAWQKRGTPSKEQLLALREKDGMVTGFRWGAGQYLSKYKRKHDTRKIHVGKLSDEEWKSYCDHIDMRFRVLMERCDEDQWWTRALDPESWRQLALQNLQEDAEEGTVELELSDDQAAYYEELQKLKDNLSWSFPRE